MSMVITLFPRGFLKQLSNESRSVFCSSQGRRHNRLASRGHQLLLACLGCTLAVGYTARVLGDVIYWTDGSILVVDKAWEEGDQVKYQTSEGINAIPRSRVQKIQQQRPVDSPETGTKKEGFGVESSGEAAASAIRSPIAIPLNVPSKDVSDETILRLKDNLKSNPNDVQSKRGLVQALNSYASLQLLRGDTSGAKNSLEQALA